MARPGHCSEIPEILKFVLKLELGPEIVMHFHNYF